MSGRGDRDKDYRSGRPGERNDDSMTSSSDPKLVESRVFIGKLPTDQLNKSDLRELFAKYGRIIGLSLHRGFAFVQYDRESNALDAVKNMNGHSMKGSRIDVKMAAEGKNNRRPPSDRRFPPPPRDRGFRERSPIDFEFERGGDRYPRRDPYADPYGDLIPHMPPPPRPKVDCEIVALAHDVINYAESISYRLKNMGVIAAINRIDEADLTPCIDAINRRKLPYAIVLNSQNESHRSITLNILHGIPQEHRNMPLDDAMNLIARNFDSYLEDMKSKPAPTAPLPAPPVSVKEFLPPDEHTHYLLNLLADDRILTLDELNIVIKYLMDRKARMLESLGTSRQTLESGVHKQQEELQHKILNILNGGNDRAGVGAPIPAPQLASSQGISGITQAKSFQQGQGQPTKPPPQPVPPPNPKSSSAAVAGMEAPNLPSINFDNPNIQKALDNLIQNGPSLLQNLSSTQQQQQQQFQQQQHQQQQQRQMMGSSQKAGAIAAAQGVLPPQQQFGGYKNFPRPGANQQGIPPF